MKVKKLPNVLALHLKRFKYQEEAQKFIKLTYRVAFPFELRLFNTVDDAENADRLYELFAIVVHIGGGPHHGHYTTIIHSQASWFLYDDDNVESIKESEIPKYFGESSVGAGYVLFYQASDMKGEGSVGTPESESPPQKRVSIGGDSSNAGSSIPEEIPRMKAAEEVLAAQSALESMLSHKAEVTSPSASVETRSPKNGHTLRRPKSEKNIPAKLGLTTDHPPPPVPKVPSTSTKRPKTGDGTLGISSIFKKRTQDPLPSSPQLPNTLGPSHAPKHGHSRALSALETKPMVARSTPLNGSASHSPQDSLPKPPRRVKARPSTAIPPIPTPKQSLTDLYAPSSLTPNLAPPSTATKETTRDGVLRPLSAHNPLPPLRTTPSPEMVSPLASPPSNNITAPLKKAARKMSLSSMSIPIKFGGLGRRERER